MIGLIAKIGLFFVAVIGIALIVLNVTNVWNPGTLSWTAPDVAPCHRWIAANRENRDPQLVQVRWIWTGENYGWGCYIEFGDFNVETVSPMPK